MMGTKREHSEALGAEDVSIVCDIGNKKVAKIENENAKGKIDVATSPVTVNSDTLESTDNKTVKVEQIKPTATTIRKQSIAEKLRAIKEKISREANGDVHKNDSGDTTLKKPHTTEEESKEVTTTSTTTA